MSKAKRNNNEPTTEQVLEVLHKALTSLAESSAKKLAEAGAERKRLLTPKDGDDSITITKEWLEQYADVHIDLGAASAVGHVCKTLCELFELSCGEGNGDDAGDRDR